ncbi:hypothetical protein BpHYR1_028383 [Brachionus plicatilis]|uniref:Uncharacterized protein n=1 Tax=Brachionus plicatilis TaxID=10195 RepID=A0A3M7RN88_BRAPC|nr:hypothetical protein BpHYR1_028383 [Brachionus plicatilis]
MYPSLRDALKIVWIEHNVLKGRFLRTLLVMPSKPGDASVLVPVNESIIYFGDMFIEYDIIANNDSLVYEFQSLDINIGKITTSQKIKEIVNNYSFGSFDKFLIIWLQF